MPEEQKIIKELKPHPLSFFTYYLIGVFIMVMSIWASFYYAVIGIFVIILAEVFRRAETYKILETGVEREFKFITTSKTFADYSKIQDVTTNQSIMDRIFGIGNVKINTAGGLNYEINFNGIKNPHEIEKMIQERLRK